MSLWAYNNTFPEVGDPKYVFECVVGHSISGLRLNPLNLSQRIEFIVDGGSALLDERLIELYSEEEYRFFLSKQTLVQSRRARLRRSVKNRAMSMSSTLSMTTRSSVLLCFRR